MLHVYHAVIGDKEFECSVSLPAAASSSQASFEAAMQTVLDELSDTLLAQLGPQEAQCLACHTAPAVRLLHHPMLFAATFPPRVEDLPQPLCASPECEAVAAAQHKMDMALAAGSDAYARTLSAGLGNCCSRCFHCNALAPSGAEGVPCAKLLRCSRCKVARYCSAACQRADWAVHKRVCVVPPPTL